MEEARPTCFVEKIISKIIVWVTKHTAVLQAKLIPQWIADRYNRSECCATAGILVACVILLLSWLLNRFMPESVPKSIPIVIRIALALFALWWAAGAFSYPLKVVFVDLPKGGNLISPTRSILLLFFNCLEITIHFASLYLLSLSIAYSDCQNPITCPLESLYFSIVTITTLGYGDICPIRATGKIIVSAEVLIGIVLIVAVLARFLNQRVQEKNEQDQKQG